MLRGIIENLMGEWAVSLLNFYEANSLAINLLVVLYGAVIVLSWVNLKYIRRQLLADMAAQLRRLTDLRPDAPPEIVLKSIEIPWERATSQARFPFVAHQNAFVPRRTSLRVVQALLSAEELAADAMEVLEQSGRRKKTVG